MAYNELMSNLDTLLGELVDSVSELSTKLQDMGVPIQEGDGIIQITERIENLQKVLYVNNKEPSLNGNIEITANDIKKSTEDSETILEALSGSNTYKKVADYVASSGSDSISSITFTKPTPTVLLEITAGSCAISLGGYTLLNLNASSQLPRDKFGKISIDSLDSSSPPGDWQYVFEYVMRYGGIKKITVVGDCSLSVYILV